MGAVMLMLIDIIDSFVVKVSFTSENCILILKQTDKRKSFWYAGRL